MASTHYSQEYQGLDKEACYATMLVEKATTRKEPYSSGILDSFDRPLLSLYGSFGGSKTFPTWRTLLK